MKILIVNTGIVDVPPQKVGAVELHTYHLVNELAALGNEVHYATSVNNKAKFHKNVVLQKVNPCRYYLLKGFPWNVYSYLVGSLKVGLKASFCKEKFDIIHCHGTISGRITALLRKEPVIYTVHNATPYNLKSNNKIEQIVRAMHYNLFERKNIEQANYVIIVGNGLLKETKKYTKQRKIIYIPNGVDTNLFKKNKNRDERAEKIVGFKNDFALFVGKLMEQKNPFSLIDIAKNNDKKIVIVGDGPLHNKLVNEIKKNNLEKKIMCLGSVNLETLCALYSKAKWFILPSKAEGLSLAMLESMSSECIPILPDVSGVSEVIDNNRNGIILKNKWWEKSNIFIDSNKMRHNARKTVTTNYSWKQMAKKTSNIYKQTI